MMLLLLLWYLSRSVPLSCRCVDNSVVVVIVVVVSAVVVVGVIANVGADECVVCGVCVCVCVCGGGCVCVSLCLL